MAFGDAQTGQLDKANLDNRAQFDIVTRGKARDPEAAKALTKKPW